MSQIDSNLTVARQAWFDASRELIDTTLNTEGVEALYGESNALKVNVNRIIDESVYIAGTSLAFGKVLSLVGIQAVVATSASSPATILGISTAAVSAGENVLVQDSGNLAGFSGLVPGSIYYMSATGGLTATEPTTGLVIQVGVALSHTVLHIKILCMILPISLGGTGATTAALARTHLGSGVTPSGTTNVAVSAVGIYTGVKAIVTGNGTSTTFTITHNLGNSSPGIFPVLDSSGTVVPCGQQATDANTVILTFSVAPTLGTTFTCTIIG